MKGIAVEQSRLSVKRGQAMAGTWHARAHERYEASIAVSVGPLGMRPVAGTVINISQGGAAIRINGWQAEIMAWLTLLNKDDEMRLTGLRAVPMQCWVVAFGDGILRVHFS
jgi:hypothetical protein